MPPAARGPPSVALVASEAVIGRTGFGRYERALLEELGGRVNLHALVSERWMRRIPADRLPPPFRGIPIHRYGRPGTVLGDARRMFRHAVRSPDLVTWDPGRILQILGAQVLPGAYVDRAGFDLVHGTENSVPRTFGGAARVITIHDAIPLTHPEGLPRMFSRGFVRPSELRPEDHVITDSETALRDLSRRFDHPRDRFHVIPLAPDHRRFTPGPPEPAATATPYVLSVGIIAQHKNLVRGLRAFERLAAHRPGLRWKVIGLKAWGWKEFRLAIARSLARDRIDVLGSVPDDALASYYRGARALLFPSLVEGFGIPVLEAMACGTPVAAASIPVIREIAGDAFVPFDPSDEAKIAEALEVAAFDEAARERLRQAGTERAARFTWPKAAEAHLRVYAAALGTDVEDLLAPAPAPRAIGL